MLVNSQVSPWGLDHPSGWRRSAPRLAALCCTAPSHQVLACTTGCLSPPAPFHPLRRSSLTEKRCILHSILRRPSVYKLYESGIELQLGWLMEFPNCRHAGHQPQLEVVAFLVSMPPQLLPPWLCLCCEVQIDRLDLLSVAGRTSTPTRSCCRRSRPAPSSSTCVFLPYDCSLSLPY